MIKGEKGITLLEVIIALAIMGVVLPLITQYIIGAFKDNGKITDKMRIQTTVNVLMNTLEKHIMEANIPVTDSDINGLAAGDDKTVIIEKPDGTQVELSFDSTDKQITLTQGITMTVYDNIIEFEASKIGTAGAENGMSVGIKAELNGNEHSLRNTYYTRNTISS